MFESILDSHLAKSFFFSVLKLITFKRLKVCEPFYSLSTNNFYSTRLFLLCFWQRSGVLWQYEVFVRFFYQNVQVTELALFWRNEASLRKNTKLSADMHHKDLSYSEIHKYKSLHLNLALPISVLQCYCGEEIQFI